MNVVKAWAIRGWDASNDQRLRENVYETAVLSTLVLGFWLRVNGWLGHHISFWYDESMWAMRLLHLPLKDLSIRPIGFMWLTRVFVQLFGATEVWFRLLPALGALGSLLLFPYVVSQLISSKPIRLLALLLFAIHPALIDYANEFKPYSWEVLIHLAPIALYLRWRETQDRRWFYGLLTFLPLGFLLAYNLAFAYPGLLLLCLFVAWRSSDRKRLVAATLASGFVCAATGAIIFSLALSNVTQEERTESYWGGKYHVFYERTPEQSRVDWTLEKYDDMAAFVGIRRNLWSSYGKLSPRWASELGSADRMLWIVLSFAGLLALWRTRRDLLWVLLAPLLVMLLGNYLGKWPLGAFRTNLFIVPYVLPLSMLGLQLVASSKPRAIAATVLVFGLTLVPGFRFGFDWHGHKRIFTRDHYGREILAKLYAYRKEQLAADPTQRPITLLLEPHSYSPYSYYLHDHPQFSAQYQSFFDSNFAVEKVNPGALVTGLGKRIRREKRGMWIVSSSLKDLDRVVQAAEANTTVVVKERIADQHVLLFLKPKAD